MKRRWAWRWTVTYPDGAKWWGTCPRWASQPLNGVATLTVERVLAVGGRKPCNYPGCTDQHVVMPNPF